MFTCDLYVGYIPRGVIAVLKGICIVKGIALIVSKEVPSIFITAEFKITCLPTPLLTQFHRYTSLDRSKHCNDSFHCTL